MNKENTPEFHPSVDYQKAKELYKKANDAIWELESMFTNGTAVRSRAYRARVELGSVEDHILRVLGIRGN
jgi:hypothetical protein